jgi:hypothetical protein
LLLFFSRFAPSSSVPQWNALLAGGPEQKKIIALLERDRRYLETAPTRIDYAIPGATPCYYRIHSLKGFSAFHLSRPGDPLSRRETNLRYSSDTNAQVGEATLLTTNQLRFVWAEPRQRPVAIISETLNTIRLSIAPGPAGNLVRTDTFYPGWRVETPSAISQTLTPDGFLSFSIPAGSTELVLRFEHSHARLTKLASGAGALLVATLLVLGGIKSRRVSPASAPA